MTRSASASMTTTSSSAMRSRAPSAPTIAGNPRLRARIAVCEVGPPSSVTKPARSTISAVLQVQHVRRRQVAGDQHQSLAGRQLLLQRDAGRRARCQRMQHTLDHLPHVGRALTQVLVVDRLELPTDFLELDRQRPFGVHQPRPDEVARRLGQQRVVEYQQMQVEECAHFRRRIRRNPAAKFIQFIAHRGKGARQARDLVHDVAPLDRHLTDFQFRGRHADARGRSQCRGSPRCQAAPHASLRSRRRSPTPPRRIPTQSARRWPRPPFLRPGHRHRPSARCPARPRASSRP